MYLSENIGEIKSFKPARLATGKKWFIEYYIYNIELKKMVRKKIMLNSIEKLSERRAYANNLIRKLNSELAKGWNPYIEEENAKSYVLLKTTLDDFIKLNQKKYTEGDIREATILSYQSYYNKINEYIVSNKFVDLYVYCFNKDFIVKYLDHIYHDLNLSSRTRDNYLKFIRLLCNYLVERSYFKVSPAEKINVLGKSKRAAKNRTVIPANIMEKVSEYLKAHNKNFLLAAQILYFCMVRPKEMSYIKIRHIDLNRSIIFIPGETAKNYKDAVVTIPASLNALISEMGIMEYPSDYYLFSESFKPGREHTKEKQFSRYWERHVRKDLGLPLTLKFYSLKDTGITDMIRKYNDPIIARDQARHHDLSITNIYTPSDLMRGNERIKSDLGTF